jgi:hypothetical protein
MLRYILRSLSPSTQIGTPELAPPRLHPKPLPEAALRHGYNPTSPLFGPMWRDPETMRAGPRRAA